MSKQRPIPALFATTFPNPVITCAVCRSSTTTVESLLRRRAVGGLVPETWGRSSLRTKQHRCVVPRQCW
eukprot:3850452-Rhodomonas_salina.1